jgi:predicted negative regulator of RcsB-dependent stress response
MDQRSLYQKIKSNPFYILTVVLIVIAGVYFIYHWFQKDNRNQFASPDDIERISVEDAYQAVQNGEAILVDTAPLVGIYQCMPLVRLVYLMMLWHKT